MELFEMAHVINKKSSREESKKRQLKQMLQGYKINDKDAIKISANLKIQQDESFSGSFSESDLMNLTQESNKSQDTIEESQYANCSVSDVAYSESNSSSSSHGNGKLRTLFPKDTSSVSKYKQEKELDLKDDPSDKEGLLSSDDSVNEAMFSAENSINTVSEDSQPFDPEGKLATKIKQKLYKRENTSEPPFQVKKIKISIQKKPDDRWLVEDMSHLQISKQADEESISDCSTSDLSGSSSSTSTSSSSNTGSSSSERESGSSNEDSSEKSSTSDSVTESSIQVNEQDDNPEPFVSMQAPEFFCGSLTDILSDYKCPITRVLPCLNNSLSVPSSKVFTSDIVDTGLIGSDEESDIQLSEQFDTNVEGSVIDETETLTENPTFISEEAVNSTAVSEETLNNEEAEGSPVKLEDSLIEQVKVYYSPNGSCIIVLCHPVEIHIQGKVQMTALAGTAEILGYTMQDKACNIFAPYHNYAHYLRTVEKERDNYGLFGQLTSSGLTVFEAEEIVTTMNDHDVVLKLQKLNSRRIEFVEKNFTSKELFSKYSRYIDSCFIKASNILGCSLYLTAPWKCFDENPAWRNMLAGTDTKSRGIIVGGKGMGKSTFLRYTVNKLLAMGPVLVVDLDPGQCEFTPAGVVAATLVTEPLLGPSYTHLKTPDEMLNIGLINVMDNLNRYTNAVSSLIAHCARNPSYQNIPWVVNTMGLCNTVGLKVITLIILLLKPTFLVQMDSKNAKKRFENFLNAHTVKGLYFERFRSNAWFNSVVNVQELDYAFFVSEERVGGRAQGLPPRDQRFLNILAYFAELLEQHPSSDFLGVVPYKVPLERFRIGSNVKFEEEAIVKVINGKIVALCEDAAGHDNGRKLFTLADKPLRCYGYGLVRGATEGALYIVTPESRERLVRVAALLVSDWTPELRVEATARLPDGTALPYRTTTSSHSHKQLMLTPRRRFNPIQLLKNARSA